MEKSASERFFNGAYQTITGAPCVVEVGRHKYRVRQVAQAVKERIALLEQEAQVLEGRGKQGVSQKEARKITKKLFSLLDRITGRNASAAGESGEEEEQDDSDDDTDEEHEDDEDASADEKKDAWWRGDRFLESGQITSFFDRAKRITISVLAWMYHYRRIVLPCIILAIVLIGMLVFNRVITFHNYAIAASYSNNVSSGSNYKIAGNNIYKYNADGISCVSRSNDIKWSITYSMQGPIADVCGTVMAVAEQQGMKVHIVDKEGEIGSFETDNPILKIKVSEQGLVAVILAENDVTWVNLYQPDGTLVASDKTTMMDFGYPVDCAISPDGTRVVVSYIKINGGALTDDVVFYHFGQAGQKKENHIVGKWTYDGVIVPEVYYVDDSQAVAVSGEGFTVYTGTDTPRRGTTVSFAEEIISSFHEKDSIGFIFRNTEDEAPYRMELYRLNGKKRSQTKLNAQYTSARLQNDQILLFDDRNMTVYTSSGHLRFQADYEKTIVDLFYLKEYRKYLVITPDSFDRIRIGT